jgi:hypothetical protein
VLPEQLQTPRAYKCRFKNAVAKYLKQFTYQRDISNPKCASRSNDDNVENKVTVTPVARDDV